MTGFALHSMGSFAEGVEFMISCHIFKTNFGSKALHLETSWTLSFVALTRKPAIHSSSTLPIVMGCTAKWFS